MRNILFDGAVPAPSGFMQLQRVWEVQADESYQNRRPGGVSGAGWVLVRTLAGAGYVEREGGRRLQLGAGSLLLLKARSIRQYGCAAAPWTFWWFECGVGSTWPFPEGMVLRAPPAAGETEELEECARRLRGGSAAAAMGSSLLLLLCHRWRSSGAEARHTDAGARRRIQDAMQRMALTADRPLPLPRIAEEAHLSEGYFRRLFGEIAGCSPKAYYENLRLARAVPWLQTGEMKLCEIAQRLDYSSAFHFSRAFKKRYGRPPSAYFGAK